MLAGEPEWMICPAPNHAVDLDLAELREPSFKVEPPALHLHTWFPGDGFGSGVTHHVPIGTFDGPPPFFGPDGKLPWCGYRPPSAVRSNHGPSPCIRGPRRRLGT